MKTASTVKSGKIFQITLLTENKLIYLVISWSKINWYNL